VTRNVRRKNSGKQPLFGGKHERKHSRGGGLDQEEQYLPDTRELAFVPPQGFCLGGVAGGLGRGYVGLGEVRAKRNFRYRKGKKGEHGLKVLIGGMQCSIQRKLEWRSPKGTQALQTPGWEWLHIWSGLQKNFQKKGGKSNSRKAFEGSIPTTILTPVP